MDYVSPSLYKEMNMFVGGLQKKKREDSGAGKKKKPQRKKGY